jgi:hypothetical protein
MGLEGYPLEEKPLENLSFQPFPITHFENLKMEKGREIFNLI